MPVFLTHRLGESRDPTKADLDFQLDEDFIQMREDVLCPRQNVESLTAAIYGNLQQQHADSQHLSEQAILTMKNRGGDVINDMILQSFP
ncbi:MAG: hypothetical protein FRX49_08955 [Trebouxia sp. A1-2]|nr:MAG: hypothetical protein FRX49_08955 [Trebouxia sp. A1-2]